MEKPNNIFNLEDYKKKWVKNGPPTASNRALIEEPALISGEKGFKLFKEYDFTPPVRSDIFYDHERTQNNKIGERSMTHGKCIKFLMNTEQGPCYLFEGVLEHEADPLKNGLTVYFGVIYNKTDPTRSSAIDTI